MEDEKDGLAQLMVALPHPALLLGSDTRILVANPPAISLFGAWIIGGLMAQILRQPSILTAVERVLAQGGTQGAGYVHVEGELQVPYDVQVSAVGAGVLVYLQNASPMTAAAEARRDFAANVSHELRTPLTAIMGFIETLQGPAAQDAGARTRFLEMAAHEAGRMNRLVGDLLSLSRVESVERSRPTNPVDLPALVGQAIATLSARAKDADVTLEFTGPKAAGVLGDSDQLLQVLLNLIENAIKYGAQPGQVAITLEPLARDPILRGPAWRLAVTDHGAGIAAHHLPRLAERFYRIDTHRSRAQGGTGLGLAIVKHIARRHRGRLTIDSTVGQGSCFALILPQG